jgi:hypothetical protein
MRKSLLAGLVLALAAMVVVIVGSVLELDLESAALLGAAMGAVVALVPDRTPAARLGGFAIGFVVAWVGYAIRAQFLPDTAGGRAVAVGVVVLLCVALTGAGRGRLALWSVLLGAGAFAGAYEFTYDQAPPEMLSTSLSTATMMAFNVAVGFLAAAFFAPAEGRRPVPPAEPPHTPSNDSSEAGQARLDDFMKEPAK